MIEVKNKIGIPKYKQIIAGVENAIDSGELKVGSKIPSLNEIKEANGLSRDTVLVAFNELKNRGIIKSVVGKGYYVSSEDVNVSQKVFLLFDELNYFKEDLYNSFLQNMGSNVQVNIYFHHFNPETFKKVINDNLEGYNYYAIMPANLKKTAPIIDQLPKDKVFILDQLHEELNGFSAVYQNFERSIFSNLTKIQDQIFKYDKIVLVFSDDRQPMSMYNGFKSFCDTHEIPFEFVKNLNERELKKGELFITPEDRSLLQIIKKMKKQGFVLARDIGIISYNETLLKEIVEGGITTISTDFVAMGKSLADMMLNKEQKQIENPSKIIIRNSL